MDTVISSISEVIKKCDIGIYRKEDSFYDRVAECWVNYGFQEPNEVYEWYINGFKNPKRVLWLKLKGQTSWETVNYVYNRLNEVYHDYANLIIEEDLYKVYLRLMYIYSPNKGTGTKIMQSLCQWADYLHKDVYLEPTSQFGSNINRLILFYEKFDFKYSF